MAGFRPERSLELIADASELLTETDLETYAVIDDDAELRNLFPRY